jgi:hypothetical protein
MKKYKVYATKTIHLEAIVEAKSQEEAEKFADYELITDDFTEENTEFLLGPVVELTDCCSHDQHENYCDCCMNTCNSCSTLLTDSL